MALGLFWWPGRPLGARVDVYLSDVVLLFVFSGFLVIVGVHFGIIFMIFNLCCQSERLDCGTLFKCISDGERPEDGGFMF